MQTASAASTGLPLRVHAIHRFLQQRLKYWVRRSPSDYVDQRTVEKVDSVFLEPIPEGISEAPFVNGRLGLRDLSADLSKVRPGRLFEDPDFPADDTSLRIPGISATPWFRPKDVGLDHVWTGTCIGSVKKGRVDDGWLVEAMSIVSLRPDLLDKVFNEIVSTKPGVLQVQLWRFGSWVTVVLDDRLPVTIGAASTHLTEMWPAAVEKAFAKLHGSYAALAGGDVLWGLEDMTGGVSQRLDVLPDPQERVLEQHELHQLLFRPLRQGLLAGALISCRPRPTHQSPAEHLTAVAVVGARRSEGGGQLCVQGSRTKEKRWFNLKAFASLYTSITVTTLGSGSRKVHEVFGSWVIGQSAGGSRNDLEKFATNPQYLLTVDQPDDPHVDEDFGRCSLLLALLQEHRRSDREFRPHILPIAYFVYKADNPGERLSAEYFLCVTEEASTGPFVNRREVAQWLELEPGNYVVIPATWAAGQQGSFLLRVCALKPFVLNELPAHSQLCAMLPTWVPVTQEQ